MRVFSEADLSCVRSVLSCQRCKNNGVCIILKRHKNSQEALETLLELEAQRFNIKLESKEALKRLVMAYLRWLCKVVRDKPEQLGLCEEQAMTALVSLDELLRLCIKEDS